MAVPGEAPAAPRKRFPWWILLLAAVPVLLAILGMFAALAIYGVRKYITNAKAAEGRHVVVELAKGLSRCASAADPEGRLHGLPPTAGPVPRDPADVSGRKYQSAPADWSEEAYDCAGFTLSTPQYFQYQWERLSPTEGRVVAVADFSGRGTTELRFQLQLSCAETGACVLGSLEETR
jgi:type IV pilus assembly protein PilA